MGNWELGIGKFSKWGSRLAPPVTRVEISASCNRGWSTVFASCRGSSPRLPTLGADRRCRPGDPAFGATALPQPGKLGKRILPASAVIPDRWHTLRRRETSLRTHGRSSGNLAQPPTRPHFNQRGANRLPHLGEFPSPRRRLSGHGSTG